MSPFINCPLLSTWLDVLGDQSLVTIRFFACAAFVAQFRHSGDNFVSRNDLRSGNLMKDQVGFLSLLSQHGDGRSHLRITNDALKPTVVQAIQAGANPSGGSDGHLSGNTEDGNRASGNNSHAGTVSTSAAM
jgi:hypothetical protein